MNPQAVRYGWEPFPEPELNLTNSKGIPASPFSTLSDQELYEVETKPNPANMGRNKMPNVLPLISKDNGPELE